MSDNKELFDEELRFDEDIDFEGLDDFNEEEIAVENNEEFDDVETEIIDNNYEQDYEQPNEDVDYSYDVPDDEPEDETDYNFDDCESEKNIYPEPKEVPLPNKSSFSDEQTTTPVAEYEKAIENDDLRYEPPKSKNISINKFCIVNTAVSAVTLCAVAAGIVFGYGYINSIEKDLEIKNAEIAKLEEKNTILETDYINAMKTFEEETQAEETQLPENETDRGKIIFYDSSVGYSWMPVLTGIKQHDYINENFTVDNRGRITYTDNDEISSYFGIDVSSYQGDINWQLVKEDSVEFAFLRIGYRGYGEEGKLCPDEKFVANYDGAHDAGVDLGIYFFSQAVSVDEAIEEANYVLSLLEGRTLEYPIVFDWETVQTGDPNDIPRTEDVMPSTLTQSAIAFCETIKDAGYDAMIYTNKKLATIKYDLRMLSDYPIWLAYYDTELNYCYDFDIWQYGTGQVDGIEGEVDINVAMIK